MTHDTHTHVGLGLKGGYVGTCLLALATVWSILSGLGMWKSDLSLDFPVNVNDALSHAQLITSLKGTRPRAVMWSYEAYYRYVLLSSARTQNRAMSCSRT